MRGKKIVTNVVFNIILQVLLGISGLIVPKLIMTYFGSAINGMIFSITQFLTYAMLVEAGIGDATVAALYEPIAKRDNLSINMILVAARKSYIKAGTVYFFICLMLALLYSQFISQQMEPKFVFQMVLLMAANGIIDFYVLGKYKIILIAEQKYYIINIFRCIATIIILLGSVFLLCNNYSIITVKLFALIVHVFEVFGSLFYVRVQYPDITYKSKKIIKIPQKINVMVHQISTIIVYNTDVAVLTICLSGNSLLEISVYTSYAMVGSMLNLLMGSMITGVAASFGDMYAKKELKSIVKSFKEYEFVYFTVLFVIYTCFIILVTPFIACYTKNVFDVNYIRVEIGILFALNYFFANMKEVSRVIIVATGHYKETQKYAVTEAIINIFISIILVFKLGIVGVLIGTLISHMVMTFSIIYYTGMHLLYGTLKLTITRILRNVFLGIPVIMIEGNVVTNTTSWIDWIIMAFIIFIINSTLYISVNVLCEKECVKEIVHRVKKILIKSVS